MGVSTSNTLNNSDSRIIDSVLGKEYKAFASAAARIYHSEKGTKKWTRLAEASAVNFVESRQSNALYFVAIDLKGREEVWKQELYLDLKYDRDSEVFHSFEGDDGMFGILFADSQEAEEFYVSVVNNLKGYTVESKMPKDKSSKSKSKSILGVLGFRRKPKKESTSEDSDNVSDSASFISTSSEKEIKKEKEKKKKKNDSDLTHDDVSEPRDFRHLSHIGFNPEKGTFDVQNIPDEWKTLFSKAGITQAQLENRSTAQFIAGFVQDKDPQMQTARKGKPKPPAPVPMKKKNAPPPPPPSKSKPSPLKSSNPAPPPPPPPPKKSSQIPPTKAAKIPQAPPAVVQPKAASGNSAHSALMDSIRGTGIGILKHNDSGSSESNRSSAASTPKQDDPHSALMASIKSGASLKPAPKTNQDRNSPVSPSSSVASTDPTDMMAAMLAKALAARNRKLAADSSDEEGEDSEDSRW